MSSKNSPPVVKNPEFTLGIFGTSDNLLEKVVVDILGGRFYAGQRQISFFRFPNVNLPPHLDIGEFDGTVQFFVAGHMILNVLKPPREFKRLDGVIWIIDSTDQRNLLGFIPFLSKILEAKREFPPMIFFDVAEDDAIKQLNFLHFLKTKFLMDVLGGIRNLVATLRVGNNDKILLRKLRILGEIIEDPARTEASFLPLLTIEQQVKEIERAVLEILSEPISATETVDLLITLENQIKKPITRTVLRRWYGLSNEDARIYLNTWESLADPQNQEKIIQSISDYEETVFLANQMLQKCERFNLEPSFNTFKTLGVEFAKAREILAYLIRERSVFPSFHKQNESFNDFTNIEEFIVIQGGQTIFSRNTLQTTVERTTLFAGMVQAIEVLREEFLKKIQESFEREPIELLDFGPLKALIGTANALQVKVIVRLQETPRQKIYKRLKLYLEQLGGRLNEEKESRTNLNVLENLARTLFEEYFNPIPLKINFFKKYIVREDVDMSVATFREKQLLEQLRTLQPVSLKQIIDQSQVLHFSKGDLVSLLLELIKNNTLIKT